MFKCSRQKLQAIKYLNDVVFYRNEERKTDPDVPFIVPHEFKNNFYLDNETIKLIYLAIEDLNLAIVTLKNTRNYQFTIFPASQAIEKLLKACLIEEELKYTKNTSEEIRKELRNEYGHQLFYILQKLECYLESTSKIVDEVKKIPYSE
ncbi:HEPN domain-containing protein [Nostoc sp.]|uniref:HEPN domain-containing protein n=1 Tax=Nostoc sp. TaxID=1180 RepID=UPI002FF5B80E